MIARTTQEAIVVNLQGLNWAEVDTANPRAARRAPGTLPIAAFSRTASST